MTKRAWRVIFRTLLLLFALTLASGCLFHTKEDPEDGGVLGGGTLRLDGFPIGADGIDPMPDVDGGGSGNLGEWCQLLVDCVCEELPSETYDDCVNLAESSSESDCQDLIESYYSECIED